MRAPAPAGASENRRLLGSVTCPMRQMRRLLFWGTKRATDRSTPPSRRYRRALPPPTAVPPTVRPARRARGRCSAHGHALELYTSRVATQTDQLRRATAHEHATTHQHTKPVDRAQTLRVWGIRRPLTPRNQSERAYFSACFARAPAAWHPADGCLSRLAA